MGDNKYLIIIAGPTASGKTALSIELAKYFKTVILSADSRQLYKEMCIGTAKPSSEELAAVSHYFIDHISVKEDYNAGKYEEEALELLAKLFKKHQIIFMVGGSGLYIKAVTDGFDEMPDANPEIRETLINKYEEEGIEYLQQALKKYDPKYYEKVDRQNPQRLMRALEICLTSGKKYSDFRQKEIVQRPFSVIKLGMELPRKELYNRINARVDMMMEQGLMSEAKELFSLRNYNALQTVGYQEIFDFFEGKHSLEEAIRLIKRNSRRYAKRQMTWFRREKEMFWFHPEAREDIISFIEKAVK